MIGHRPLAMAAIFDVSMLVGAVRHVFGGNCGDRLQRGADRGLGLPLLGLAGGKLVLEAGDLGLERSAAAMSLRPMAAPISFDAALRRSCIAADRR